MKFIGKHFQTILGLAFGALTLTSGVSFAACDQTLSAGADLAAAITTAAAGTTICLNPGTYAQATLNGVSKTSDVTLQSVSGRTASVAFLINNSNHLKFQNLTISKMDMRNNTNYNTNISVVNNTFTGQMLVDGSGNTGINVNILVDHNTFDGINICSGCYTGRLQLWAITGVTVTNNHFGGGGTADGIQWGGYGGTVGPGNIFDGVVQSAAGTSGAHIDAIQLLGGTGYVDHGTIAGNFFGKNTTHIMAPDGADTITIRDNVFTQGDTTAYWKIQLGSHNNDLFIHNTVFGTGVSIDAKTLNPAGTNNVARDNIMIGSNFKTVDSAGNQKCTNCTFTNNLFDISTNAMGTNNIIGTPTFVGGTALITGTNPSTWSGYQLTSSSLGYKAGTDGRDLGTSYYGSGVVTPPSIVLAAPKNLRLSP
ncbi:MAG: hypothetical protein ACXVB1_08185 [Pseudobdellovibrionaceae bacterium]